MNRERSNELLPVRPPYNLNAIDAKLRIAQFSVLLVRYRMHQCCIGARFISIVSFCSQQHTSTNLSGDSRTCVRMKQVVCILLVSLSETV